MNNIELSNGVQMPALGLGVWKSGNGTELAQAIETAIKVGYRHFDTAAFYQNESGLGNALKSSGLNRSAFFVTTKIWNDDQGFASTLEAFERSLAALDMEYVDLLLVHWPVKEKYLETWKALEIIYNRGLAKAIGVSNFMQSHLEVLLKSAQVKPMVNQIEHHPFLVQRDLLKYCKEEHIQVVAWSPLMQGRIFDIPELAEMAQKYQKTVSQVVLRWNIQNGLASIPKSTVPDRIFENFQIDSFELSQDDMELINRLDKNERVGPDPYTFV